MLRSKIAIQEYSRRMIIIYKEGKIQKHEDGLGRWTLNNDKSNPSNDMDIGTKTPRQYIHFVRKRHFKLSSLDFYNNETNSSRGLNLEIETPHIKYKLIRAS
ncbi:hypothetical protein O181_061040 [Austropuccinia psidii MF-1]|uniref:Uncharacterized protein n=1 Tax=Austropuccinia psidii MF-1 TaxID=1389203 RepID=A0A9Q3EEF2_9BASI|nr:hypothetical protein [Austropuccinia psidii MF-1]